MSRKIGKTLRLSTAALAVLATFAMGSATSYAQSYDDGYFIQQSNRVQVRRGHVCRPANGGEIAGSFAGPSDYVDVRNGDICPR